MNTMSGYCAIRNKPNVYGMNDVSYMEPSRVVQPRNADVMLLQFLLSMLGSEIDKQINGYALTSS